MDQNETAITDFAIGNFSIVEDGKPSIVTTVKRVDNIEEPLSTAIVIDRSGSMGTTTMELAKTAAITYVNAMRSTDSAEIILYDDQIEVPQTFTSDKSALISAINSASSRGATATYSAIVKGAKDVAKQKGRKIVLAMTDGDDNASDIDQTGCIREVNARGLGVYIIGAGGGVEMSNLISVSNGTGGRFYEGNETNLSDIYQKILYQLNNQVQINFRTHIAGQTNSIRTM